MALISTSDVERIMGLEPLLTDYGIGICRLGVKSPEQADEELLRGRSNLSTCMDEVEVACRWLALNEKAKTAGSGFTTYSLKHYAELYAKNHDWGRAYVCNGAMIVAVIHMGFPYRVNGDSPNPEVGISRKTLFPLMREIGYRV